MGCGGGEKQKKQILCLFSSLNRLTVGSDEVQSTRSDAKYRFGGRSG